jgi:glycerol-3-phosphate dehydrogenase
MMHGRESTPGKQDRMSGAGGHESGGARGLTGLAGSELDILVVGGGITGACLALEAVRRGLTAGLVERDDYGGGATANCLKIIHGGLRYLQRLDLRRVRESTLERSIWLRSAPHLVEPLPVLLPTYRGRFPPRAALVAALAANEVLSADRNRGLGPDRAIPRARVLSRRECVDLEPSVDSPRLTGGVLFHDALMYSPERVTLEVVEAARRLGAVTTNHVEFVEPILANGRVAGARLRDTLTGAIAETRTRWIVNATGSAAPSLARHFSAGPAAVPRPAYSVALNFVTRQPARRVAFTVAGDTGGGRPRQLFVVPWRGQTMIGTAHLGYSGDPAAFELRPEQVDRFAEEVASARPTLALERDDIAVVHAGLLPVAGTPGAPPLRLLTRHRIVDHAADGCAGAVSVVTVKFTTARAVARDVLARIAPDRDAGGRSTPATLPLPGGDFISLETLRAEARSRFGQRLPPDVLEHLVRTYGAGYGAVLEHDDDPTLDQRVVPDAPVIRAQLVHAVRVEQARTVADLLWRRTELGPRGLATEEATKTAEEVLAGASRRNGPVPV